MKAKTKTFNSEAQYAEDIAIFSDSSESLQSLLTSYHLAAKRFGLQINAKRTEVMCLGPEWDIQATFCAYDRLNNTFRLGNHILQRVKMKKDLGVSVDSNLSCTISVNLQGKTR